MGRGGLRIGAGRPGWHIKAEHCLRLDVRDLARRELLLGGAFSWRWKNTETGEERGAISIAVSSDSVGLHFVCDGSPVQQTVPIERTPCHYGGTRPWFRCPCCHRRVAVLYLRGGRFMCRYCGRVVYASQSDDLIGRTWRRQWKLERRLGENWRRPKGMHRRTRERILERIFECESVRDEAIENFCRRLAGLAF